MDKLQGKTAIVTGSGRGIGLATARLLARDGATVIINDLDKDTADEAARSLLNEGLQAIACPGSVTDPDFPDQLVKSTLDATGRLDILVNNAGYIWNGAMHNHSDEQWQAMLDIHATAPFRLIRALSPWLRETAKREIMDQGQAQCRKIVNISSVSGTQGSATQIAYSAGKAAVVGITKTLAKEWGRYNVTVNCVAFGHIETRLTQAYSDQPPTIEVAGKDFRVGLSDAQIDAVTQTTPLGRPGRPEDAAGAVYLFCIPESDFVSGQVLTCAGGA